MDTWWAASSSVLAPEKIETASGASGTRLALVGEISSLEDNEQLTAMRFVGNNVYAVTFRAIDPLVTLDLSDPLNPKKVAELTMPGFSTYLQPIDANHLLAIGEDLPVDSNGVPDYTHRSIELSLFDVTDLANPQRTALALVGTAWAESEALWDHHAFNWYQPDPTKPGIPRHSLSPTGPTPQGDDPWDGFVSDVRLFSADPAGSITPLGALGNERCLHHRERRRLELVVPPLGPAERALDRSERQHLCLCDRGCRPALGRIEPTRHPAGDGALLRYTPLGPCEASCSPSAIAPAHLRDGVW